MPKASLGRAGFGEVLREEFEKFIPIFSPKDLPIVTTKAARYHGNPVLTRGGPGAWDEGRVDNPCVVWDADDKAYWMWYSGRDANDHNGKVGLARSKDGITWTKNPHNPVFDDTDTLGYPNHNTEVASVLVDRIDGRKVYLMAYEQELCDADWRLRVTIPRVAISYDRIHWTKLGDIVSAKEPERWDGGKLWKGRDGLYHYIAKLWPKGGYPVYDLYTSVWKHFTSSDFIHWEEDEETMVLGGEIYGRGMYKRVDDLEIIPLGTCFIGLANYFTYHAVQYAQPLEMLAGPTWNRLTWIGNCIYPAKEIAENATGYSYHEACFVMGSEEYGPCPRIYYFQQWNEDEGKITKDINMAYLMLGTKRTYPVLQVSSLAAGASTSLGDCTEIPLEGVNKFCLTVECTYSGAAGAGDELEVHLRGSVDGVNYDDMDLTSFLVDVTAGATVRKTAYFSPEPMFVKVICENLSDTETISDIKVMATLGR